MRQIVSALRYLHKKTILHSDLKLDNILVHFDNEEDRKNKNMMKVKVKLIDFGFAIYLKKEELAYSTLGSPINMDPGILRKLNKMQNCKDYGYDEKADIWSLGTICYEMLIGKCAFDPNSMKDLVRKVDKGDYFIPKTLSKEAVSFLNGMLQYDFKRRLTAAQLYRHKFLKKNFNELTKINPNEIKKNIKGSKIRINSKMNQSIWDVFGGQSVIYDNVGNEDDIIEEVSEDEGTCSEGGVNVIDNQHSNGQIFARNEPSIKNKLNEKALEQEFIKVFEMVNDDFISIEPKLIPIILGDNPEAINKISEFGDDNF